MATNKVKIWKKASSKNVKFDTCPIAEDTALIMTEDGKVEIHFTSGTVNKSSDYIIEMEPVGIGQSCLAAIGDRKEKPLTDYTEDELYAALKAKHINGG